MLQQGDSSTLLGNSSSDVNSAAAAAAIEGALDGGAGGEVGSNNSAGEEDNKDRGDGGDRSFGGNRWPRKETLALLKIRSDMDQVFRDSSLRGPLWEEVSRKLAELGYNRSAKKCKEKFENVYKYHKRTKGGRAGKPEGKNYKFFDQLEALDHHHHSHSIPQTKNQTSIMQATSAIPWTVNPPNSITHVNVSSAVDPISIVPKNTVTPPVPNPTIVAPLKHQTTNSYQSNLSSSFQNVTANLFSSSTSSSTASDEESEEIRGTRKRKWKEFFRKLTKEVIKRQEQLQDKFLEEIERREHERIVREEAWRVQEMSRINREHEILIQERSTATAKDAAVIAFLQNISSQQQNPFLGNSQPTPVQLPPTAQPQSQQQLQQPPAPPSQKLVTTNDLRSTPNKPANGGNVVTSSSSRWPKAEVESLIKFRTDLANKYHESGPKAPLWGDISAAMRNIGYNRNAKRCKEKWENINKYFKKVKESNKKRLEDSKTCPYFNQLDALYKEKSKTENSSDYGIVKAVNHNMAPLMVQPKQKWPVHQHENQPPFSDQIQDDEEEEEEDIGDSEQEYEEEEGNAGYEILANKSAAASLGGNSECDQTKIVL